MDEFNKELCNERHNNINNLITKLDNVTDKLFTRMNWFMLTAIAALMAALIDVIFRK